jgi:RHS repeat-associated protein
VDFVQWTGPSPQLDPSEWQKIEYKHDLYGRRSEKKVDGFSTRYLYDGPQVIAEYDGNNNLLRKYIYGPGIDQPVCMIEQAESQTYYYHYDALGSVVALSDSSGDTVQTYEYSVYGQVAVEDVSHPNPYMFAGRRYDIETGLYYNRARYYNPYTGRFLQMDPIGYKAGMNLYRYCRNNSLNFIDPFGLRDENGRLRIAFFDSSDPKYINAANDFDFFDLAFDMKGHDTYWILMLLEDITTGAKNRKGEEIVDIYFFDDSTVDPRISGYHVVSLEFGSVEFTVDDDNDLVLDPDLAQFLHEVGTYLVPEVVEGRSVIEPGGTIHLRHDFAAQNGMEGSGGVGHPMGWLTEYAKAANRNVTAVSGVLVYTETETPGPDYEFSGYGNNYSGGLHIGWLYHSIYSDNTRWTNTTILNWPSYGFYKKNYPEWLVH